MAQESLAGSQSLTDNYQQLLRAAAGEEGACSLQFAPAGCPGVLEASEWP